MGEREIKECAFVGWDLEGEWRMPVKRGVQWAVGCREELSLGWTLPFLLPLPSHPAVLRSCSPAVSHLKFTHSHFKLLLSVLLRLPAHLRKIAPAHLYFICRENVKADLD